MPRTRSTLAVLGLLATCFVAATAAPPAAAAPEAPAGHAKPFSAGTVTLDATDIDDGHVVATSTPLPGLAQPRVVFASTGDAEVTGTDPPIGSEVATSTITAIVEVEGGDEPADPAEAALADASGTTLVATLRASGPNGVVRETTDVVWLDEFRGHSLASEVGELDLRLQRVDVLEADATITPAEADALRERIRSGGAVGVQSVVPGSCVDLCVSGTIRWTDSAGGTHPVDRATVEIRDEDGAVDPVVGTATTDGTGAYSTLIVGNDDGDATGLDLYVHVLADGPSFTLDHAIAGSPDTDVPTGSVVTQDLTATNVADNNTAFSVRAALVLGHDQVEQLRGSALPTIAVAFPDPEGSFYDGDLHLLQLDRFDWDVALHEFGHYVADTLNIEDNPGGPHSLSQNLSDARGSKAIGTRLAWGEGWPSFFAVSTLFDRAGALGVPDAGDSRYQDGEDSTIDVSLEAKATLGEDNERTVMNILWDVYDAHVDGRDHLAVGSNPLWDALDAADPETLSEAYAVLSPNRRSEGANCVSTDMNVAPRVDGPASVDGTARPPTLRWRRGNGGSHRNNSFSVAFRSNGGSLLFASPFRNGQSYTPSRAQWSLIRERSGGTVRVSVVGRQIDEPRSGPYRSCTKVFT